MSHSAIASACLIVLLGISQSNSEAGLALTLDFTDFDANAPANLNTILLTGNALDTDTARLNAAKGVMNQAKSMLEGLFSNCNDVNISHTISVGWASHGGSRLATGGTGWLGNNSPAPLTSGTIEWDNDGSSVFFVDPTPADNSEYTASANDTRSKNFGGTNINVENRFYANFSGTVAENSDMLSTAIHEMMHAVGVIDTYPNYSALDTNAPSADLELTADGNTYNVGYTGGHTNETLDWDGPGMLSGSYYPNVIGPATVSGTRGLLTDLDALLLANLHGWGDNNNFACVNQPFGTITTIPEPGAALCMLLVGSVAACWQLGWRFATSVRRVLTRVDL